mgnify:FL=1
MSDELLSYFRGQQVPLQWYGVLRAMAAVLPNDVGQADLRRMMFRVGQQFAQDTQSMFEGSQSLADLQDALNDFWTRVNWGSVRLTEVQGAIAIQHHWAPLAEAFGDESLTWSVGLLEGYYQYVFGTLGADPSMGIRIQETQAQGMDVQFQFGLIDA